MNFTEALTASAAPPRRNRIDEILDQLDPADRADVETALADPTISSAQIARALTAIGQPVGRNSVQAWRTDARVR